MTGPPATEPAVDDLRTAAARGFLWSGGQALFGRALSLLGFVVLARLLTPKEYGIVALANVFAALFALLSAAGYSQALVQRPTVDKEDLDTLFCISLLTSAVLALIMVGAAWPLANLFDEPQLRPVLQVLSVNFIFVAMGGTHQAVLQRRLAWRSLALRTMVANTIATAVGIAFAFLGFGVWALVVQTVLGIAVGSVAVMLQSGYRPSPRISWQRFLALFPFSRNYLGNSLLAYVNVRADDFLIGSVLGSAVLGIYAVAYRVLVVMMDVLSTSVRAVALPVFSRIQDDRPRLLRAYQSANRTCCALAVPTFAFACAAAPEIVQVIFGSKWQASVPVMRILCFFGMLQCVSQFNTALLSSVGRIRFVFRVGVVNTLLQVVAFAATVRYGIEWVAASYVIRSYLTAPVNFIVAARELDTTAWKTVSGFVPSVVAAAAMAAAVLASRALLVDRLPDAPLLGVLAIAAVPAYLLVLRLLGPEIFAEGRGYLQQMLSRRARRTSAAA